MSLLTKIFGSYSDRELKQIYPIVDKIEALEPEYKALSDYNLIEKTEEFKELAHKIAMQVASMSPLYVSLADIPENVMKQKKQYAPTLSI